MPVLVRAGRVGDRESKRESSASLSVRVCGLVDLGWGNFDYWCNLGDEWYTRLVAVVLDWCFCKVL